LWPNFDGKGSASGPVARQPYVIVSFAVFSTKFCPTDSTIFPSHGEHVFPEITSGSKQHYNYTLQQQQSKQQQQFIQQSAREMKVESC
jgi:hypothetical protein